MSHECQFCGQECYCDGEDVGGMPQPSNCSHLLKGTCESREDCEEWEEGYDNV